tara:strand:+ start:3553 stop:4050 length:498 start_codon:yes stop_codon:yes gene_type:complete
MAGVEVLDTSALVSWAVDALEGGFVVDGQREEVNRVAPERILAIEAARLNWITPSNGSLKEATEIAMETGDIVGLSKTDLSLLALAIEKGGRMHTDDYRLQNLCSVAGLEWSSVDSEGISRVWSWELRCPGCGDVPQAKSRTLRSDESAGDCKSCGSALVLSRKR